MKVQPDIKETRELTLVFFVKFRCTFKGFNIHFDCEAVL